MNTEYCLKCMQKLEAGKCPDCKGTAMIQDPRHLTPGTILKEKYLTGYSIGAGGFGITYIGRDLILDTRIAIKEYYPSQFSVRNAALSSDVTVTGAATVTSGKWNSYEKSKERFLTEARILARFEKDDGIVNVKDFFEANNTAYIVMEYIDGLTLKEHLEQHGNFAAEDIVAKMRPIMESLARVHEQGLLHRDISPDNIKMPTEGNLKLLDFGAARYVSADLEKSITNMTKAGYAPEEQYRSGGDLGPWSDIYALCATIYKCITSITPSDAPQRLHNKTRNRQDIATPSELGVIIKPTLESAILKGMSVLQEERYQSISELLTSEVWFGVQKKKPDYVLVRQSNRDVIALNKGGLSIGRIADSAQSSYIISSNHEISRKHFVITEQDGDYFAMDCGSKNGTFLNGVALSPNEPIRLRDGDEIRISIERFVFQIKPAGGDPQPITR